MKSVQLAHGSGGQAMQQLIGDLFMQAFANPLAGGAGGSGAPRSGGARRPGGPPRLLHRQLRD